MVVNSSVVIPQSYVSLTSRLVNGILSIKPIANFAKKKARNMMIKRAEAIGVPWRENVRKLQARDWQEDFTAVENTDLVYPAYYLSSFHAYEQGNLSWQAALEAESAAYAVHAKLWQEAGAKGDQLLRQSYHQAIQPQLSNKPQTILDIGCSVGMSTLALQKIYPQAKITGLDLSPYFLAVAKYRSQATAQKINWVHGAAESTGLEANQFDLVSAFLLFHEVPQQPTREIFAEVYRLLRPGGYFTIMDMNPASTVYATMPPYVLTLLKSTEPFLDQYFSLDIESALTEAGFNSVTITPNSPRHRTIVAQAAKI